MSIWIKHDEDSYIPDWLKESLPSKCSYCGSPMANYYNDDYRCTNRRCTNPSCYGYVAARADFARKLIGIKGVGFAGCLKDAELIKAKSPFELFRVWQIVPVITLEQFLRIHCFEGIDSEWGKITQQLGVYTLDELYEKYDGKWKSLLEEHKEEIYNNQKYVKLQEKPKSLSSKGPELVLTIMITGTPIGFQTKDHFINIVNNACNGKIVIIHQKTKKQSGVDFLIREPGSTTRGKVDAAKRGGIPIVTSKEFLTYVYVKLQEMGKNEE